MGAALGLLFWLFGEAARGSRAAQLALGGLAAFALFAYFQAPKDAQSSPEAHTTPSGRPVAVTSPSVAAPPSAAPVATVSTRAAAAMKTTTGANLRSGPSPQAKVVEQLPDGAIVEVVGGEDLWAKVWVADDKATGWVA